jgi:hypothetical protein
VGVCKVNWDAAVDGRGGRIWIGAVVRDHSKKVLAMLSETIASIKDPTTAEALAARRGTELYTSLGIRRFILEGDALQIVQAIQSSRGRWYSYGLIIEDIQ